MSPAPRPFQIWRTRIGQLRATFAKGLSSLLPPANRLSVKELLAWLLCLVSTVAALFFLGSYIYISHGFGDPLAPSRAAYLALAAVFALTLLVGLLVAKAASLRRAVTTTGLAIFLLLLACSFFGKPIELRQAAIDDGSPAAKLYAADPTNEWDSPRFAFKLHPWYENYRPVEAITFSIPHGVDSLEFFLTKPKNSLFGTDGKPNQGDGVIIEFIKIAHRGSSSPLAEVTLTNQTVDADHWISRTIPVDAKMEAIKVRVLSRGTPHYDQTLVAVRPHGVAPFLANAGQRGMAILTLALLVGVLAALRDQITSMPGEKLNTRNVLESSVSPALLYLLILGLTYSAALFSTYGLSDSYLAVDQFQWNYIAKYTEVGFLDGRPLQALWNLVFYTIMDEVDKLHYLRGIGLLGVVLFAIVVRHAFKRGGLEEPVATLLPLLIVTMPPFQVFAAWDICSGFPYAAVLGGLSFRAAQLADESSSLFWGGVSVVVLTAALALYQPAAMAFWLFAGAAWLIRPGLPSVRSVVIAAAVVIVAFGLEYFVVLKSLPSLVGYSAVGGARGQLVTDPIGKAVWYISQPLRDAFNLGLIYPSNWLAVFMVAFTSVGLWLYGGGRPTHRGIRLVIATALLPLAYLPNLIVKLESGAYRTQVGMTSLVALYAGLAILGWLQMLRSRPLSTPVIAALTAIAIFLAARNVATKFVAPQVKEWQILVHALRPEALGNAQYVYFVRPTWPDSFVNERYDEYGQLSTTAQAKPMIRVALREHARYNTKLTIAELPKDGATAPENSYVLDFPKLFNSFRVRQH